MPASHKHPTRRRQNRVNIIGRPSVKTTSSFQILSEMKTPLTPRVARSQEKGFSVCWRSRHACLLEAGPLSAAAPPAIPLSSSPCLVCCRSPPPLCPVTPRLPQPRPFGHCRVTSTEDSAWLTRSWTNVPSYFTQTCL